MHTYWILLFVPDSAGKYYVSHRSSVLRKIRPIAILRRQRIKRGGERRNLVGIS